MSNEDRGKLYPFLNAVEGYMPHIVSIWGKRFDSPSELQEFFDCIPTDEDEERFLRIGCFYRFLVVEGRFQFDQPDWNSGLSYIDETYKFVAIFSLIEALEGKDEFSDFYQWMKQKLGNGTFDLEKPLDCALSDEYENYKASYGAIKNAMRFFARLDDADRELLEEKFSISGAEQSFEQLAKLLYQIRSDFVHHARLVLGFGEKKSIGMHKNKILVNDMTLADMQRLFENGFLKRFGFEKDTRQEHP